MNRCSLTSIGILAAVSAVLLSGCGGNGSSSGSPTEVVQPVISPSPVIQPGLITLLPTAKPSVQALVTENIDNGVLKGFQFIDQSGKPVSKTDPSVLAVIDAVRNPNGKVGMFDCENPGTKATPQYVAVPTMLPATSGAVSFSCAYASSSGPNQPIFTLTVNVSTDASGKKFVTDTFVDNVLGKLPVTFGPVASNGTLSDVIAPDMFNYLGTGRAVIDQSYVDEFSGPLALVINGS